MRILILTNNLFIAIIILLLLHVVQDPDREEYNPGLFQCIKRVPRMPGCEAAYFFAKDVDVCDTAPEKDTSRAGNLVINVRSGDIFKDAVLSYRGQVCILYLYRKNMMYERLEMTFEAKTQYRGVS